MKVLVTGGAGYIGSHTCVELLNAGHDVIVIDNLSNSKQESLNRVEKITGKKVFFYKNDIRDKNRLLAIFQAHTIDAVIHFAGYKAVGESVEMPLEYYQNNLTGTLELLSAMKLMNVKNLVFSSSATVYGDPHTVPIKENFPLSATNPYGRSKLMVEEVCADLHASDNAWNMVLLRYFNPVGAHKTGLIGEDPSGIPNNLMPYISQVAIGKHDKLFVYGNDYETADGTGVRDYIHVVDLAKGHVHALEHLASEPGLVIYNLGTGTGYSVLEMIAALEVASGRVIPYEITEKRAGDIAVCYADTSLAREKLNWQAQYNLNDIAEDTWRWQLNNPDGY